MSDFQITEMTAEPNWTLISQKYMKIAEVTHALGRDIGKYNDVLRELDGLGTSVNNGRDRLFLLREEVARMESEK